MTTLKKLLDATTTTNALAKRLTDQVEKLTADVDMLKAQQPIIVQHAPVYRAVSKADDNGHTEGGALGKLNGHVVDMDALARDVRRFAEA
jgi:hypothetical protein